MELVVERGANRGQRFSIAQTQFTIGRAAQCDVILPDELVSHYHADLWWQDGAWIVQDHNSVNCTWVNRQRLHGPYRLQPGDQLGLGRTIISFTHLSPFLDDVGTPISASPASSGSRNNKLSLALNGSMAFGALLLISGALLNWFSFAFLFARHYIRGVDAVIGKAALSGGLLAFLLAGGAVWLRLSLQSGKQPAQTVASYLRWVPWVQIGIGAIILVLALIEFTNYNRGAQAEVFFGLRVTDLVKLSPEPGIFVTGAGLALLLLGAGGQIVLSER